MTEGEAIEKLQRYFMTQDKEVVCELAGGVLIDIMRIYAIVDTPMRRHKDLWNRIEANIKTIDSILSDSEEGWAPLKLNY